MGRIQIIAKLAIDQLNSREPSIFLLCLIKHTIGSSEQPMIRDLFLRKATALKGLAVPTVESCTHTGLDKYTITVRKYLMDLVNHKSGLNDKHAAE